MCHLFMRILDFVLGFVALISNFMREGHFLLSLSMRLSRLFLISFITMLPIVRNLNYIGFGLLFLEFVFFVMCS
jgi:hypothetical protein